GVLCFPWPERVSAPFCACYLLRCGPGFHPKRPPVTLFIDGIEAQVETSDGDGNVTFALVSTSLSLGTHILRLEADGEGAIAEAQLTVEEDPEPVYDPT